MNGRAMGQKRWKASHLADMGQARRWFFCAHCALCRAWSPVGGELDEPDEEVPSEFCGLFVSRAGFTGGHLHPRRTQFVGSGLFSQMARRSWLKDRRLGGMKISWAKAC